MAVGADYSIRSKSPSGLTPPRGPAAPQQSQPSGTPFRRYAMNDNAVSAMANNQRAAGVGAGRMALAESDRAGMSRGKGQQYLADIAEAGATAAGNNAANMTESGAGIADANAQRAFENTASNERLSNAGLLEGLRNNKAMERLAGRGWQQDIYEAMRRGRFGLDQQQLDYTPLLGSLFQ